MKKLSIVLILGILMSCSIPQQRNSYYRSSNSFYNSGMKFSAYNSGTLPDAKVVTDEKIFPHYDKTEYAPVNKIKFKTVNTSSIPLVKFSKVASNFTIILDPGHGGKDPGGSANGVVEKVVVLDVAKKLQKLLKQNSFNVVMTRTGDTYPTLADRVNIANKNHGDLMLSIHANIIVGKPHIKGTLTIYPKLKISSTVFKKSKKLAEVIQSRFKGNSQIASREKGTICDYRGLHILRNAKIPTVLTEIGFMTNKVEAALLKTEAYKDKIAVELYNSIVTFLN